MSLTSRRGAFDIISGEKGTGSTATLTADGVLTCTVYGGSGSAYARGIYDIAGGIPAGTELAIGASVYLHSGYYTGKEDWSDLLRLDSYVYDNWVSTPDRERQYLSLACWRDDTWSVQFQAVGQPLIRLLGPFPASLLPEGAWHTLSLNVVYGGGNGAASTELVVNGKPVGSSGLQNYDAGRNRPNSARYGIVSTGPEQRSSFRIGIRDQFLTFGASAPSLQEPVQEPAPVAVNNPPRTRGKKQKG